MSEFRMHCPECGETAPYHGPHCPVLYVYTPRGNQTTPGRLTLTIKD